VLKKSRDGRVVNSRLQIDKGFSQCAVEIALSIAP